MAKTGSGTSPSIMDEERMRSGHTGRSFLQCFDTEGWLTGWTHRPEKDPCHLYRMVLFHNGWRKKLKVTWLTFLYMERKEWLLEWRSVGWSHVRYMFVTLLLFIVFSRQRGYSIQSRLFVLFVCTLKWKRLELSSPNFVHILDVAVAWHQCDFRFDLFFSFSFSFRFKNIFQF